VRWYHGFGLVLKIDLRTSFIIKEKAMNAKELRESYLQFFEARGHRRISSASLLPENDPTVLFTTAGMHPLVPFLLGESHPLGKRLTDFQKCIRTNDIDEVGDALRRPSHGQRGGRGDGKGRGPAFRAPDVRGLRRRLAEHAGAKPLTAVLNNTIKYVASTTLKEPLPWRNSTLLEGEATKAVAELKEEPGKDLVVLGSGELVQSLMRANLVDEYMLLIHPLVLGTRRRLFTDGGASAALRLVDTRVTTTGVVIATYRLEVVSGQQR
jgi:dihydrofolate reductase